MRELRDVTVTCSLNFACFEYQVHLQWSLEEPAVTSTSLSTKTVSTQSTLTFQPQWTHHGKNLTCQLWDPTQQQLLSEETVWLDVKRESPHCVCGRAEGPVIPSPPQRVTGAHTDGSVMGLWAPAVGNGPGRAAAPPPPFPSSALVFQGTPDSE